MVTGSIKKEKKQNTELKLNEWSSGVVEYSDKDQKYLNKHFSNTITYTPTNNKTNAIIEANQYVGVLRLPDTGTILKISPKTPLKYMNLLSFAQQVECKDTKTLFKYDDSQRLFVKEGHIFLEMIGNLFVKELEKIIEKGLYKEYVKKEENTKFLKGKLEVQQHIKKNFVNPNFYCSYYDLTFDNFTNRTILYAAWKLGQLMGENKEWKETKTKLFKYVDILKSEIKLQNSIMPYELEKTKLSKKNIHYKNILELTEIVIKEYFYESIEEENIKCCNFLIDMNVVFERVVFGLLKEILENNGNYTVIDQSHYIDGKLIDIKNLQIIPDITVLQDGQEKAVVDAKYKSNILSSDHYQIIIYSLILKLKQKGLNTAVLINFREMEKDKVLNNKGKIKVSKIVENIENDISIWNLSIYLGKEDKESYLKTIQTELAENFKETILNIK